MRSWSCNFCYEKFETKEKYIEHIKEKLNDARVEYDTAMDNLESVKEELYLLTEDDEENEK